MRPVLFSLFAFLMLTAGAFAFSAGDYLTGNETNASIAKDSFSINGTAYYIANMSGKPTFLVKAGELVENKTEIAAIVKEYYVSKYYPSQGELGVLRNYFLAYNASRNDGARYKGYEENACRGVLLLNIYPCRNETSCNKTATAFCGSPTGKYGLGCNDPSAVYDKIVEFANASDTTEELMKDIFAKLDALTSDNVADYISKMKNYTPTLKSAKDKMEKTTFRTPNVNETCAGCTGVCPDIDFNDSALAGANSTLNDLSKKAVPFSQYAGVADQIYNNTQLRFKERTNSAIRASYLSLYNPVKALGQEVRNRTIYALSLVDNATVRAKLAQLNSSEAEIDNLISSNNFSAVNASISAYSKAASALNSSLEALFAAYGNVSDAYKLASTYLFIAESKALGAEDLKELYTLKQQKIQLDAQFKKGLTATQYADMLSQYSSFAGKEKALVSKTSKEQALYIFTGMANKFMDALDTLLNAVRPLTYAERAQASSYAPAGISALLFASFSSMVIFLFLVYYAISPKPMNKALLVVLALLLVFLVGLVSIGIFLSMDHSFNKLEYSNFVDMVKYSRNATIVVKKSGSEDNATLSAMNSCASLIASSLAKGNISSTLYEMSGWDCIQNKTIIAGCLDKNYNPVIMLNASDVPSSGYSGLLTKQATLSGDQKYYELCAFAEALKIY